MRKTILATVALAAMVSCASDQQPKALVLYYSQTNTTKAVAEEIALQTGADIEAFDVEQPYDGTYQETIQRGMQEKNFGTYPKAKALESDLSKYDIIYLGYPVWFGTCANPVFSLLESVNLSGKTIVPFCTFGSGGLNTSVNDLRVTLPGTKILDGYGVRQARVAKAPAEIARFLVLAGLKEGSVEEYPEFSAQEPVNEETSAIFDAACSSYPMPLGTPSTVGYRQIPDGTEYLFTVAGTGADGTPSQTEIYVIAGNDGSIEFTQAVR